MTPDDFAAILAARTVQRWVAGNGYSPDALGPVTMHPDDARAAAAAVNLAPLLLDLWRTNVEMLDDWDHRGTEAAVWVLHRKVRAALAALEAAT